MLTGNIFAQIAHLMTDTVLNFGFRLDTGNGFRKFAQTINTGDMDISQSTVVQIGQHGQPMMRPFLLRNIQTEQFFFALYCQCEKGIDCFGDIAAIFSDFVVDGIDVPPD